MNLWIISGLLLLGVACVPGVHANSGTTGTGSEEEVCRLGVINCTKLANYPNPVCFNETCISAITDHIAYEFHAAFKYLYMGAVYGQFITERPGLAKFFLESASEERGHAIQMMDYLNMRGFKYNEALRFSKDNLWKINNRTVQATSYQASPTIRQALQEAVNMEIDVTEKILKVVAKCADDYHAADVFTNPILEEQYTGLRKLQGAIRTYDALMNGYSGKEEFVQFIFDMKVQKGEVL